MPPGGTSLMVFQHTHTHTRKGLAAKAHGVKTSSLACYSVVTSAVGALDSPSLNRPVVLVLRCRVRGRVCVRGRRLQRLFAREDGGLLRPDGGPLVEREQHAGPPIHSRRRRAQRAPVRRGRLRRQHR